MFSNEEAELLTKIAQQSSPKLQIFDPDINMVKAVLESFSKNIFTLESGRDELINKPYALLENHGCMADILEVIFMGGRRKNNHVRFIQ